MGLTATQPDLRDADGEPILLNHKTNHTNTQKESNVMSDKIFIFDTTLRDAEQTPGAALNLEEKLEIAKHLAKLNVDIIEAGFPVSSPGDFDSVERIANEVEGPEICALSRVVEKDITVAWGAIKDASKPRIHTFVGTSPVHRGGITRTSREETLKMAIDAVAYAKSLCAGHPNATIEFSPMDAARTEPSYLHEVVEATIDAGATVINIPDTVGYALPSEFGQLIADIFTNVSNIDKAIISVHCHNDLGLAVANSLAAVEHGAGQIECTINGIGERAGNCSLEEIVMALRTRTDFYGSRTVIDTTKLVPTSRLVASITGIQVQRNKAIVGRNAFAHEAGIHQDGMLKERTTYEIMRPEDVGFVKTDLVLGKHSGRAALADRAVRMGYTLTKEQLQVVFEEFKRLADKKKEIYDGDIRALVEKQLRDLPDEEWSLVSFQVTSGTDQQPQVRLTLSRGGVEYTEEMSDGDGPIDAAFLATEKITGLQVRCKDYQVRSATLGRDALGEVTLEVEYANRSFRGRGVSTDTVEATVMAILDAVNRIAMTVSAPTAP